MTTGERIKALRLEKNMSQEELGEKVGVQKAAINKYETGIVVNLKRGMIAKLADALDTTPAYLMGWEDEEQERNELLEKLARNEDLKAFMMTASKCTPEELRALEGMIRTWKKSSD